VHTSSILDTRDLLDELRELAGGDELNIDEAHVSSLGEDERGRLDGLLDLMSEVGDEFQHGVALIPEDEFVDYAREFAEGIGALPESNQWPAYCIDWEYAARELRMDYSSVTFDGVDYLFRA
jgi:hypothetical protein